MCRAIGEARKRTAPVDYFDPALVPATGNPGVGESSIVAMFRRSAVVESRKLRTGDPWTKISWSTSTDTSLPSASTSSW
jgi:hypothetical protein